MFCHFPKNISLIKLMNALGTLVTDSNPEAPTQINPNQAVCLPMFFYFKYFRKM